MTTTPSVDVGLWTVLEVYLTQRRALGFRLVEEERHARRFLEWLQAHGHAGTSFSVAQALSWAQGDGSLKNSYQCQRLSAVRGLARYCHAIGLNVQVPPANVLPTTRDRRRPHIYTQGEVDALIDACPHAFTHPLVQATMAAVIALLAVTGMRPGEVVRLRLGDINVEDATLLIRANKHGPDRLIPLHPTTLDALAGYLASPHRQAATPPLEGTLFVTTRGKAYQRATVEDHFQRIRAATGITWEGHAPCLVDLRHTFATRQMIRAYTTDAGNPAATLGLLALWLGHSDAAEFEAALSAHDERIRVEIDAGDRDPREHVGGVILLRGNTPGPRSLLAAGLGHLREDCVLRRRRRRSRYGAELPSPWMPSYTSS